MLLTQTTEARRSARAWVGASLGTMVSVFPSFLTGALGVQLRAEVGLTITEIGIAMGSFFGVAAILSAPMGRMAQWMGPRAALRSGLTTTAVVMVLLASFADSGGDFWLLLGVAGAANSLTQPSANLLLASEITPARMGMALAVKQSGMPMAALLGGAAVPALALTLGWQSAYLAGAVAAVLASPIAPGAELAAGARPTRQSIAPDLPLWLLGLYSVVGLLGAANATAMVAFLTSAAEASGVGESSAGLLLSFGSAAGICSRLYQGHDADRNKILPIRRLAWLYGLGAVGVAGFIFDTPLTYAIAAVPAFGFGWAWPGLFNLSVIRRNPSAPASATGISQIGVFVGAGSGPVVGGIVVDQLGYQALWISGATLLLLGAGVAMYLRTALRHL